MRVDNIPDPQTRVSPSLPARHTKPSSHSHPSPCLPLYLSTGLPVDRFPCLYTNLTTYLATFLNQVLNSSPSIFSTARPQRSIAQPQKSKSMVEILAWMAAQRPQPTSDMIIFNFIRAIKLADTV